jgi:hypothetical protein
MPRIEQKRDVGLDLASSRSLRPPTSGGPTAASRHDGFPPFLLLRKHVRNGRGLPSLRNGSGCVSPMRTPSRRISANCLRKTPVWRRSAANISIVDCRRERNRHEPGLFRTFTVGLSPNQAHCRRPPVIPPRTRLPSPFYLQRVLARASVPPRESVDTPHWALNRPGNTVFSIGEMKPPNAGVRRFRRY